ncbi:MAG: DUF6516 family protein, partial [Methanosarcinales archaeon]
MTEITRTLAILSDSDIVVEVNIKKILIETTFELIKANAKIIDGSVLYISDIIGEGWRNYSYHWQKNNELIMRWDNAPHHRDLPNFPHHIHIKNRDPEPHEEVSILLARYTVTTSGGSRSMCHSQINALLD